MSLENAGSALYSVLTGGTALVGKLGGTAIYNRLVPQGTACPYVLFFRSAATEQNSSPRRARDLIYTVKAVTQDDLKEAEDIDVEIDTLLHGAALTITGWGNYWTARETDISYLELGAAGVIYYHVGAQYRVRIAE